MENENVDCGLEIEVEVEVEVEIDVDVDVDVKVEVEDVLDQIRELGFSRDLLKYRQVWDISANEIFPIQTLW